MVVTVYDRIAAVATIHKRDTRTNEIINTFLSYSFLFPIRYHAWYLMGHIFEKISRYDVLENMKICNLVLEAKVLFLI